jgi:hypothetical protein
MRSLSHRPVESRRAVPRIRNLLWKEIVSVAAVLVASGLVCSCQAGRGVADAAIEFSRVPPRAEGGPDKLDVIEGRVRGARGEQRIVLYAKNKKWWVQPLVNEPFTKFRPDGTWTNSTHLGTEYAALLVEAGYRPAAQLNELPERGGEVAAVKIVNGGEASSSISKTLEFSGYEWRIRNAPSDRGGVNNYDSGNAWTDGRGALHLRIAKVSGQWSCAEVTLTRNLGYGSYSFVVQDTSKLHPAAVFSIFTWDYAGTEENFREMDIEMSRWGDLESKNGQYVVQPFSLSTNVTRFEAPGGVLTHSLRWEPGRATFRTVRGTGTAPAAAAVAEHVFTAGVPSPGSESVRMNLYIFHGANRPFEGGAEVVVEKFEYLP